MWFFSYCLFPSELQKLLPSCCGGLQKWTESQLLPPRDGILGLPCRSSGLDSAFTGGGMGLIFDWGTMILHAVQCGLRKKKDGLSFSSPCSGLALMLALQLKQYHVNFKWEARDLVCFHSCSCSGNLPLLPCWKTQESLLEAERPCETETGYHISAILDQSASSWPSHQQQMPSEVQPGLVQISRTAPLSPAHIAKAQNSDIRPLSH